MGVGTFLSILTSAAIIALALNGNEFNLFPQENSTSEALNNRPIIGVLAQEPEFICEDEHYSSYIAASYVKFAESLGARVVALKFTDSFDILEAQMNKLNGLLLPGGGTPILKSEDPGEEELRLKDVVYNKEYTRYMNVTQFLLNLAKEKNDNGIHFPVFGVCLGFQSMILAAKTEKMIELCNAPGIPSVQTITNQSQSEWFKDLSSAAINTLQTEEIVYENHPHCYTTQVWDQSHELGDFYRVTSTAVDLDGKEYVNSIEGVKYPFFGFQYHPEKNVYEWIADKPIPHQPNAIYWTQYLANQFGKHVKQNSQSYPSAQEEESALIYNVNPFYTRDGYFMQMYCFDQQQETN